jgi:hypothetical protein
MIAISAKQIKNSLLSSAGFEVANKSDDKPSTRIDVAYNTAAMIYIRPWGAPFYTNLKCIFPVYPPAATSEARRVANQIKNNQLRFYSRTFTTLKGSRQTGFGGYIDDSIKNCA